MTSALPNAEPLIIPGKSPLHRYLKPVLLSLLIFLFSDLPAENIPLSQYVSTRYQKDDGLASPSVLSLCQTQDGYLWIGTYNGLNRFNGHEFKLYNPKNTPTLASDQIRAIFQSSDLRLWIGMPGDGIVGFEDTELTQVVPKSRLSDTTVLAFSEDWNGILWAATRQGLYQFGENGWKLQSVNPNQNPTGIDAICRDSSGRIYLATAGSFYRQSQTGFEPIYPNTPEDIEISAMTWTDDGSLWIGTQGHGLFQWKEQQLKRFDIQSGLFSQRVGTLWSDDLGNLWVGCRGGLVRISDQGIESLPMPGEMVYSLCTDHENGIWLGTYQDGLSRLNPANIHNFQYADTSVSLIGRAIVERPNGYLAGTNLGLFWIKNQQLVRAPEYSFLDNALVRAIKPSKDGGIWVSTHSLGVVKVKADGSKEWFNTHNGLLSNTVRGLLEDSRGRVWMGTSKGLNCLVDGKLKTDARIPPDTTILTLHESSDGTIIVGTDHSGLFLLSRNNVTTYSPKQGLPGTVVFYALEDKEGALWISTNAGLGRLKNGKMSFIDSLDGLPSDSVFFTVDDGSGNFWMAYDNSIYRARKTDIEACMDGLLYRVPIRMFGKNDGIRADGITGVAHPLLDSRQRIWVPTLEGFARVDTDKLRYNAIPPPVHIESLQVDGKTILTNTDKPIILQPDAQRITFRFAALSFECPEENRFKVFLEGFDEDWSQLDNRHERSFTQLPPGEYTFRVQASNNSGIWNEKGDSIKLIRLPHFYETRSFLLLCTLLLTILVALAYLLRTRQLRNRSRQLQELVDQKTADLQAAVKRAEDATEETQLALETKTRFLATMGHEVRNPMNGIIGLSEMLLETQLEENQKQYIETIKNSASALTFVLNDLLDFSKLESGKISLELIEFDLRRLIDECSHLLKSRISEKNLEYQNRFDSRIPRVLIGDPSRIRQVLINLISNAIRFTQHGGIRVEARLEEQNDEGCQISISVVDTGLGISEEDQKHLFQPYQQAKLSTYRQFGGTGLGLAICKNLVELMGGTIGIRSLPGLGSTFHFTLPLHRLPDSPAKSDSESHAPFTHSGECLDVLIVDDNDINLQVTQHMLKGLGNFRIKTVDNGSTALKELSRHYYHIVLMDKYMPGMNGTEVTQKIRDKNSPVLNSSVYVIGVSAANSEEEHDDLMASGMNDAIDKPIGIEQINKAIIRAKRFIGTN